MAAIARVQNRTAPKTPIAGRPCRSDGNERNGHGDGASLLRHEAKLLTEHGKAGFVNSSIFPVVTIFCTTAHLVWGNSGNTVNHEVLDRDVR